MIDIAGPPTYTKSTYALDSLTLPEVLALYVKTRNWEREQHALAFDASLRQLQIVAAAASGESAGTRLSQLYEGYTAFAEEMRKPETPKRRKPLTEQQRQFYHFTPLTDMDIAEQGE